RILAIRELEKAFSDIQVEQAGDQSEFDQILEAGGINLAITDYEIRWTNGIKVLQSIKKRLPDCPVIMFTGTGNEEVAVEAMKNGLDDYVIKTARHFARLPIAVHSSLDKARQRKAINEAENRIKAERTLLDVVLQQMPAAIIIVEAPSGRLI